MCYLLATLLTINVHTDNERVDRRTNTRFHRSVERIGLYLDSTNGTFARVDIRFVVHHRTTFLLQLHEHSGEFLQRFPFQLLPQCRIFRHRHEAITLQNSLYIESCTTTKDRLNAPRSNIFVSCEKIALILKEVILLARITNINKMIRYLLAVNGIVGEVFSRSDGHTTIYLT